MISKYSIQSVVVDYAEHMPILMKISVCYKRWNDRNREKNAVPGIFMALLLVFFWMWKLY